jgi:hypothetical protein
MITPSYSLTATERVLPRLALDFTTAVLDPRVTFTRSAATATRFNASGYVETVAADTPRFDYNPLTLVCKGLLIEEARTNLLTYSEAFNTGWPTKTNATVTTPSVANPANGATSDSLVENGSFAPHQITRTIVLTAAAHTYSVFVKKGIRSWVFIGATTTVSVGAYFDVENGVVGNVDSGFTASISPAANGFYRCSITFTATAATWTLIFGGASANNTRSYGGSNGSEALYMYGGQLEVGAFATSYIPNVATGTTTRNADVATMTGTNFSDWYNATEGTFEAVWQEGTDGVLYGVLSANDGTDGNRFDIRRQLATSVRSYVDANNVAQGNLRVSNNYALNQKLNFVSAYKVSDFAAALNGSAVFEDLTFAVPVGVDQLEIGSLTASTNHLNGWIQKVNYWPQRLTNFEVQAFSKE